MPKHVIALLFVLLIAMVFPSDAESLSEVPAANATFLQRTVLNMEQHLESLIESVFKVDGADNSISSDRIQEIVDEARSNVFTVGEIIMRTMRELDSLDPHYNCISIPYISANDILTLQSRHEFIISEYEHTASKRDTDLATVRQDIATKIDSYKEQLKACADKCTSFFSCIGSIFCLSWNAFVSVFTVPFGLYGKHVYAGMVSDQKQLLDGFEAHVQSSIAKDTMYTSAKERLEKMIADLRECVGK